VGRGHKVKDCNSGGSWNPGSELTGIDSFFFFFFFFFWFFFFFPELGTEPRALRFALPR